jgi:hypothetical protein
MRPSCIATKSTTLIQNQDGAAAISIGYTGIAQPPLRDLLLFHGLELMDKPGVATVIYATRAFVSRRWLRDELFGGPGALGTKSCQDHSWKATEPVRPVVKPWR